MQRWQQRGLFWGCLTACLGLLGVLLGVKASVLALSQAVAVPPTLLLAPPEKNFTAAQRAYGAHLVRDVLGCGQCHGSDLQGRVVLDDGVLGRLAAANLTQGARHSAQLQRVLHAGIDAYGRRLWMMPTRALHQLSPADSQAVVAYLSALQQTWPGPLQPGGYLPAKQLYGWGRWRLLRGTLPLFETASDSVLPAHYPPRGATAAYGTYLTNVMRCQSCHQQVGGGSFEITQPSLNPVELALAQRFAPRLTDILAHWRQTVPEHQALEKAFTTFLRHGTLPNQQNIQTRFPWHDYARLEDLEIAALWASLGM